MSVSTGQLPKDCLDVVVSLIFKKGQIFLAENYRPVSLLCIISQVLESKVTPQIVNHVRRNNKLATSKQHWTPMVKAQPQTYWKH